MKLSTPEKALLRLALINLERSPPDWVDSIAHGEIKELTDKFTKELR